MILLTDGISDVLSEKQIAEIIHLHQDNPDQIPDALITAAQTVDRQGPSALRNKGYPDDKGIVVMRRKILTSS